VEHFGCTITVNYSPYCYTLADTFMNDSESISDDDYASDIAFYPELYIRGQLSLSPDFVPSIEVSIYPSSEATTPFLESELSSIGVRMKIFSTVCVWDARVISDLAERLGPAARLRALEAFGQTHGFAESGLIVHSEPVLPPGWERRLSVVGDLPGWPLPHPHVQSYFIHPESGQTSPFPPPLEPTLDGTGEF
jgi:hypothetical protein